MRDLFVMAAVGLILCIVIVFTALILSGSV
jgi:hypothetical protein